MKKYIIFLFICILFIGCGLKEQEYFFNQNLKELNNLISKANPALKKEIILKETYYSQQYKLLPEATKERSQKLGELFQSLNTYLETLKKKIDRENKIKQELYEKNMKNVFSNFVGDWKAVGMNLVITHDGSVYYKKYKSGWEKEINGTFKEFKGNTFIIKVLWLFPVTFRIDEPPHKSDNKWKMRIDGVELTKML